MHGITSFDVRALRRFFTVMTISNQITCICDDEDDDDCVKDHGPSEIMYSVTGQA